MRIKTVMTFGAAALLATGCGGGKSGSGADARASAPARAALPQKLTQPDMGPALAPSASPADGAPFAETLAYELQTRTLKMAQAPGSTTGECPKTAASKKGTTVTCTTTYEGLKVAWDVTVGDKTAWSDSYVSYEAVPRAGILTREGVAKLLFGNYKGSIDYALCNNIPKATLAPLGRESTYRCEVVDKGEKPRGYGSPVRATENGPRAY